MQFDYCFNLYTLPLFSLEQTIDTAFSSLLKILPMWRAESPVIFHAFALSIDAFRQANSE